MTTRIGYSRQGQGQPVVLLHSSLSSKKQWSALGRQLSQHYEVIAVDLAGYGDSTFPPTQERHTLRYEVDLVQQVLAETIGQRTPFHLVGHSFGGAVALRLAYQYPRQVLSLSLYEPVAFHLLAANDAALQEIRQVSARLDQLLQQQQPQQAAAHFIDYWNQPGAFAALAPATQTLFAQGIHKVSLDFQALISDPLRLTDYRALSMPVCLLYGRHSPTPTRRIIEHLAATLPHCEQHAIEAGHMAPITHVDQVNAVLTTFIDSQTTL